MPTQLAVLATAALLALAAPAQAFDRIASKTDFVGLVSGKALTRMGITLTVLPDGRIEGRAFGRPVKGDWRWQGSLFCRDLSFGSQNLGPNCQVVQRDGDTLRFIADEGRGQYADLRLR
ncbi:MAG TPA: dihydrodipicolinate reductase [Paracoccaceae bacterium]|nr:dihydrodipicolinate reductase [Paracoccaceae bacterium]HMO71474.1 dihydrodipicolinate reductase [Paracoccaceae bacterium]